MTAAHRFKDAINEDILNVVIRSDDCMRGGQRIKREIEMVEPYEYRTVYLREELIAKWIDEYDEFINSEDSYWPIISKEQEYDLEVAEDERFSRMKKQVLEGCQAVERMRGFYDKIIRTRRNDADWIRYSTDQAGQPRRK